MSENNKQGTGEIPSLEQVVQQIDKSLLNIDDSQALRLGLAAIAGSGPRTKGERYILFLIGESSLAVPASGVVEVTDLPPITKLPGVPPWVLGITNVRSEIISVVDLPLFTGLKVKGGGAGAKIIILGYRGIKTGIRIDRILGTLNRDQDEESAVERQITNDKIIGVLPVVDDQDYHSVDYKMLLSDKRFLKLTV